MYQRTPGITLIQHLYHKWGRPIG